jgi:hypothetical protein
MNNAAATAESIARFPFALCSCCGAPTKVELFADGTYVTTCEHEGVCAAKSDLYAMVIIPPGLAAGTVAILHLIWPNIDWTQYNPGATLDAAGTFTAK